jgi:hypothetical protein
MAYSGITPLTIVQESQDAMQIKIWDYSTWGTGDVAATATCILVVQYYDEDGILQSFDNYDILTNAGSRTNFNNMLDKNVGLVIDLADLTIGGEAPPDRFQDGYYIVTVYYNDGTYTFANSIHYRNNQAFLAKNRFMARKLPKAILTWPMTDAVRIANRDIFLQRMYLDAAEDSADNGNLTEFLVFMELLLGVFNYYSIEEVW